MTTLRSSTLVLGALLASPAVAQTEFADDFETCDLSLWSVPAFSSTCTTAGCQLLADATVPHRGNCGGRFVDADGSSGNGGEGIVFHDASSGFTNYYARGWFRLVTSNGVGNFLVMAITDGTSSDYEMEFVGYDVVNNNMFIGGHDLANATTIEIPVGGGLDANWHLVELGVTGAGGTGAARIVWIDGQRQGIESALDWTGHMGGGIDLGEPYAEDLRYLGTIAFDDVRTSSSPPASTLVVTPSGSSVVVGSCVQVVIGLTDSDQAGARSAPYDVTVDLASGGAGTFYSDTCSSSTTQTLIALGTTSVTVYFSPAMPGAATLTASQIDFLPGSASLSAFAPDSGVADAGLADSGTSRDAGGGDAGNVSADAGLDAGKLDSGSTQSDSGPVSTDGGSDGGIAGGPVAIIDPPSQSVDGGVTVVLDASRSHGGSGTTVAHYLWSQSRGPTGVRLSDAPQISFVAGEPGTYDFALTVQDTSGARSAPATASVLVNGSPYQPPSSLGGCVCGGSNGYPMLLVLSLLAVRRRRRAPRPVHAASSEDSSPHSRRDFSF